MDLKKIFDELGQSERLRKIDCGNCPGLRRFSSINRNRPIAIYDLEATETFPFKKWKKFKPIIEQSSPEEIAEKYKSEITEIGMILFIPEQGTFGFQTLLNPGGDIPEKTTVLNGITTDMTKQIKANWENAGYPLFKVLRENAFLLAGFGNVSFDSPLKYLLSKKYNLPLVRDYEYDLRQYIETQLKISSSFSISLKELAGISGFLLAEEKNHRAFYDALLCFRILDKIYKRNEGRDTLQTIISYFTKKRREINEEIADSKNETLKTTEKPS